MPNAMPSIATKSTQELSSIITDIRESGDPWEKHLGEWALSQNPEAEGVISDHLSVDLSDDGSLFSHRSLGGDAIPLLSGLTVGEMGVIYEALLALDDPSSRKENGQFFTPDDAAAFMAKHSSKFPGDGVWLDPCCGVGNLSWHLANVQGEPRRWLLSSLSLMDRDERALRSATTILATSFSQGYEEFTLLLTSLWERAHLRSALSEEPWPSHDYVMMNPPYGKSPALVKESYPVTWNSGELYAQFLERAANASGVIAVVPSSITSAAKYRGLRELYLHRGGGEVYTFDNMPTRLFKDFKYGSTNTSQHNQVRASIIVSSPSMDHWSATPMVRWSAASRMRMLQGVETLLAPMSQIEYQGRWGRIPKGTERIQKILGDTHSTLNDLVSKEETEWSLQVASTPRYYITATPRELRRGNKHVLYFPSEEEWKIALLYLNSALPYWWWRYIDGGIVMPRSLLLAAPMPECTPMDDALVNELLKSDGENLVVKMNAGNPNENVKHPRELVERITTYLLGESINLEGLYAPDLFPAE